jgi:hypothetical protein
MGLTIIDPLSGLFLLLSWIKKDVAEPGTVIVKHGISVLTL